MQETARAELAPAGLLRSAEELLRYADPGTAGVWPRAAALLARQALENGLGAFWRARAPSVEGVSTRAQLLCLRHYADEEVAERASYAWHALSRACHHHVYELAPTGEELRNWIDDVQAVVGALERYATMAS